MNRLENCFVGWSEKKQRGTHRFLKIVFIFAQERGGENGPALNEERYIKINEKNDESVFGKYLVVALTT